MSFRDAFASYTRSLARRTCDGAHTYLPGPVAVTLPDPNAKYSHCCIERLAPTLAAGNDIAVPSSNAICLSFHLSPSPSSSSFLPCASRSKEAKVEANHHAITAPGAANSDPFRERQQPPFAAPGHSLPLYRYSKTNNLHPRLRGKKGLSLSTIHPLLRLFSPNHRRADRSLDYWHPGNPSREWRRFHFENRSTDTPILPTY